MSPRCWLCLERLSSSAQHPLGVSLPSQEIKSDLQDFLCFWGVLCCTLAWLKLILCGLPDICISLAHSKAMCDANKPFQEALGFTWCGEHDSAVSSWFLSVLGNFRWMQCEGAADPLLASGINSSLLEHCRSDYGGNLCQST